MKAVPAIVSPTRTDAKDADAFVAVVSCFETECRSASICIFEVRFFFRFSSFQNGSPDTFFVVILDRVELRVRFLASLCHTVNFSASHFFH